MSNLFIPLLRTAVISTVCSVLTFAVARQVAAQTTTSADAQLANREALVAKDYEIGPGDVLMISVTDAPEFTGRFRVDQSGFLVMSSLPTPVKAAGKTPMQLSKDLRQALEGARLYRDPTVNVFVDEYHSRTVAVVGAVSKPGLYPLQRRTTVMEVVSQAGLLPTAGNQVTIIPPSDSSTDTTGQQTKPQTFDLGKLVSGRDPSSNVEVHDGELISVASAEVVYVVGAVTKPGGFVYQDRTAGITALQAIALAEGMTSVAAPHRGMILHRNADGGERESVLVDLSKIMTGKEKDVMLAANDILFVPVSGSKQTLHAMGQIALTAVNGAVFYGVGYRVSGL